MATTPNSNPNQLNEKQLEKLIYLLQKIDELTEEGAINLASQLQSAGNAGKELDRLKKEWNYITGDISHGAVGFREILEIINDSNEGLKLSSKVYKGFVSLADLLQKYQRGSSNVSEKEIINRKELLEGSKIELETANKLLESKNKELESSKVKKKEEKDSLDQSIKALEIKLKREGKDLKQNPILQQQRERVKEIDREYQSIGKQIEKNNTILERNTAIIKDYDVLFTDLELTLQDIGQKIKFKNIENLDEKLKSTVKETLSTDENIVKINKSFNVLNGLAQKAYDHQNGITELSGKEIKSLVQKQEYEYKSLVNKEASLKKEQDSLQTQLNDNKALIVTTKQREEELKLLEQDDRLTKEQRIELENIPSLLQKQNKISSELNEKLETNSKLQEKIHETITDSSGALNALKNTLSKISKEDKIKSIENLNQHLKEIVENAHSTDKNLFRITKSFDVINSIAQKFEDHQSGANKLSEKEAKQLLDKLESERKRLSYRYESLKLEEQELKRNEEIQKSLVIAKQQKIEELEIKAKTENLTKEEEENLKKLKVEYQGLTNQQNKINDDLEVNRILQEKTSEIINKQNEAYNTTVNNLKAAKKEAENMRKALGLSGLAVDGIGKALGKVGLGGLASIMGLDEAKEKMKEVADEITEGGKKAAGLGGQFRILIAGLKEVGASILKNLTDPVVIVTGLVAGLTAGIKGLISLFEQTAKFNGDIAKTFALSATESSKIGDNLRNAASSDFFMSNEEARQAFDAMANATGTINSAFSDGKTASAMNDMMTYAGYTAESAGELYKLGQLNNKSADEMVTSLQGQLKVLQVNNKLRINEKQAVEMVAKASATVRMNLGANPKKLADAAFYASKLGMTLDEISSAAEQTLNFESAIQNQLEYQVLTGKEINIDAYQQAAASGDAAAASKELNRLLEEQGGNIEGNFFAQEALAKTLGISREQMMKSLELQKIQKKVGGDVAQIESAINRKMKEGLTFEQAAAEASKEGYQSMVDQNKNAEVFSRTISKIKEIFMNTIASSQGFKNLLSKENIDKFVDTIKTKVIPFVEKAGKLIGKLIDPDNIDKLVAKFKEIGAILKIAGTVIAGIAALKLAQGIKNLIMGQRGSSPGNPLFVEMAGGGGMGGGGLGTPGGGTSMMSNVLKGASNLVGGKNTMVGRGLRNLTASVIKSNRAGGMMANVASKVLPKAVSTTLGTVSKLAAPATALAMTGKGLYDSLADERLRDTGVGGFFEQLGGTGMHILDTATFGATKWLGNKAGISIPGMDTDDVAAARAIFHQSGRDPDNSRTPMGLDNKQLIQDILANPSAYPEGIVEQAQNVNVEEIEDGRLNPNGGPVVSTFQKGELVPIMQGIKEDNVYMTTNKPVAQVQDGYYGRASQDNSAVIAAIKELAGVFAANNNKEITLEMNGQKVGKVLTPIMANPLVRQMNIDSVLT
jgi:hypothetical protein